MKKTKNMVAVLFLIISTSIIAGCGDSSTPFFLFPNALSITTASPLAAGTVGTAYSQTLAATGGTAPYTWARATGSAFPAGLTLSANGLIAGTPTTAGTSTFTVTVVDSATPTNIVSKQFSLTVAGAPLAISTTSPLTPGTVGTAYSQTLAATGGTAPYTWALAAGSALPAPLTLSANGLIAGTPTTAATSTFTITVTDSATPAHTASQLFSLTVAAAAGGVPVAPTGVVLSGGTNSETITWPAVTGATSYRIYFSAATDVTTANTQVTVPQPTVPVTSPYRHSRLTTTPTWLAANTTYFYIVTAVNASGESLPSTQVSAPTSAVNGVALYGTNCQGCHNALPGEQHVGASAALTQTAINNNTGGMGSASLLALTPAQVSAIADVMAAGF